jgi:hypothetical protein
MGVSEHKPREAVLRPREEFSEQLEQRRLVFLFTFRFVQHRRARENFAAWVLGRESPKAGVEEAARLWVGFQGAARPMRGVQRQRLCRTQTASARMT